MTGGGRDPLLGRRAPILFAAAVLVLRSTSLALGLVNLDECDFWLIGRLWRQGAVLYRDVADIKPPLTYAAFALADAFTPGGWQVAVPLLGLAATFAVAALLGGAARAWTGDRRAGWAAAWLSLAASLCNAPATSAELLMNAPVAGALWASLVALRGGRRRWWLVAGLLAALATLVKLQGGIVLVVLLAAPWVALLPRPLAPPRAPRGRGWTALGHSSLTFLGYLPPWAVTAALARRSGTLAETYDWVVRRNVFQISSAQTFAWGNVLPSIAAGLGAAALAWWLALRSAARPCVRGDPFGLTLVVLLFLTVLPVSIGRRFYEHYFLQFVPPLALLGAPELLRLVAGWATADRGRRAVAVALALLPAAGNLGLGVARALDGAYPTQDPTVMAIARWLRADAPPGDRLAIWGDTSTIYCASGRLPGTRYLRTAPQVGDFDPLHLPPGFDFRPHRSERDLQLLLRDLEARRPGLLVDTAAADLHRWSQFPLAAVPELASEVADRYDEVGRPGGAVVYARRPDVGSPAVAGPGADR